MAGSSSFFTHELLYHMPSLYINLFLAQYLFSWNNLGYFFLDFLSTSPRARVLSVHLLFFRSYPGAWSGAWHLVGAQGIFVQWLSVGPKDHSGLFTVFSVQYLIRSQFFREHDKAQRCEVTENTGCLQTECFSGEVLKNGSVSKSTWWGRWDSILHGWGRSIPSGVITLLPI